MDTTWLISHGAPPPVLALREQKEGVSDSEPFADEDLESGESGRRLVCRACRTYVTSLNARRQAAGSHRHVFCNPHGFVYEVGCFAFAPGCRPVGPLSSEFSWFPGYAWRITVCAGCQSHIGWRYLAERGEDGFFGLILDHLIEEDDHGD
ncbi:MAG: cereblon family protein [Desulfovibrionaceae bacterium]